MSGEEHGLRVPPPQLAEKDREENMSVLLLLVNNNLCGSAVKGNQASLKNWCPQVVWVRAPPPAP